MKIGIFHEFNLRVRSFVGEDQDSRESHIVANRVALPSANCIITCQTWNRKKNVPTMIDKKKKENCRGKVKPGFHLSRKSQTIGDFAVPSVPDVADMSENRQSVGKIKTLPITIACFHKSAKFGTVGKQRNPRSSEIFSIYENQA